MADAISGKGLDRVTDEHYSAIGRITVHFALLDAMVTGTIAVLLSPDLRLGHIVTDKMTFGPKLDLLGRLLETLPEYGVAVDLAAAQSAIRKAKTANEARNEIIHALHWGEDETTGDFARWNAKRGEILISSASIEDLSKALESINSAVLAIGVFRKLHFGPSSVLRPNAKGTAWGVNWGLEKDPRTAINGGDVVPKRCVACDGALTARAVFTVREAGAARDYFWSVLCASCGMTFRYFPESDRLESQD